MLIAWQAPQGKDKLVEAAFQNFCAARREADEAPFDFALQERARKRYSEFLRIPADIEAKAIRLLGQSHTYHHAGTVLAVVENGAAAWASPHVVELAQARALVASGRAEWVGPQ